MMIESDDLEGALREIRLFCAPYRARARDHYICSLVDRVLPPESVPQCDRCGDTRTVPWDRYGERFVFVPCPFCTEPPKPKPPGPICRGCNQNLMPWNYRIADGCPCNSMRGINHGLVPSDTCTCVTCDPEQTGATRRPTSGARDGR